MIHPRNSQSQSEPEQSKPKGRFTGERLLRERPRVYRKVVELLAEPGMSINQITKFCRVSEHTVRAVRDREAIPIAERKERLVSILGPMWPNSQPSAWKNSPPTRLCAMQAWQLASPQTSCSRF